MNILIFSWRGPGHPNAGGAEIATHEHAKSWVKAGHNVTLFTSGFPGVPKDELVDGVRIIRKGNQLVTIQIFAIYWYLFEVHVKFDLVVDQFHGIPFFTPFFVKEKKLAYIHEIAKEVWWTNHLRPPLNYFYGLIGYIFEPFIFFFYKKTPFMTVSNSTQNDLIGWGIPSSNIFLIKNGVTARRFRSSKNSKKTIIFLGAIAKDKGIEDALDTFEYLHKNHPTWLFWVVGKGDQSYIKSLSVANYVKLYGYVSDFHKDKLLSKAHILLNPSRREGWGLVNIEANNAGTPVVAYDVPGCRDSIVNGKTGILCTKGDILCLGESIERLLNDSRQYSHMAIRARKWASLFSWKISTLQSLKLIAKITS